MWSPNAMVGRIRGALADWAEEERRAFALWLPVAMGVGVLTYDTLLFEPALWIGPSLAGVTLALAVLARRVFPLLFVCAPIAAAALGFACAQLAAARVPPVETRLTNHATIVEGRIEAVEALPEGRRVTLSGVVLDGQSPPLTRLVRVRIRSNDFVAIGTGDRIRVRAIVRPPSPPAFPGGWDQQRDAFFGGMAGSGYALAPVEVLARDPPVGVAAKIQRAREAASDRIVAVIPGSAGPVAVGILIGSQTGIALADLTAFRDSGLAHILSVSGLHIAIVMGFAMATLRIGLALSMHASLFWPTRQLAAVGALVAGGAYTVFTGTQVPMIRCFIMALLFTLAVVSARRAMSLRGLGLAAAGIMLVEPDAVAGASFQMSFASVLALIAGFDALKPWMKRVEGKAWWRRVLAHLLAGAMTSLLAGGATMPFGVHHFGRVQIYFVIANMIAVPLTSLVVMPAGMIALLAMPFGLDWLPLVILGWGVDGVLWVARVTAAWPEATLTAPHIPAWGLATLAFGLIWLALWRRRMRLFGLVGVVVGLASPALDRPPDLLVSADGRLIGLRTDAGVFIQKMPGASKFTAEAWLRYWAARESRGFPATGTAAGGSIACVADSCLLGAHAGVLGALLVRGPGKPIGCEAASVIVAAEPARGLCPKPWPKLVDRFTVWRAGSAAIWLTPQGARIVTDREARGQRPWVPPPPTPRAHAPPKLPLADVDRAD